MGWNDAYWLARDHDEAISINQQLTVAGDGITAQHVIDLNRFCDCTDDGEGYDVPKERMRELKRVGLLEGGRFGWYTTTDRGHAVRQAWFRPVAEVSNG